MNDRLKDLIEKARQVEMSPQEIEDQRISFAFGNINLEDPEITRADVIRASQALKETQHQMNEQ